MKQALFFLTILLLCLILPTATLKAEITTDEEFNNFSTYYYLDPHPDKTPQALGYFLRSRIFRDNINANGHVIEMLAYFFGRIANFSPNLIREYEKFYDSEDMHGKLFLISIFAFASDEQNKQFFRERLLTEKKTEIADLIKKIIDTPQMGNKRLLKGVTNYNDLDFFWIEFFVTGDKEPIHKIIQVLTWEDKFRDILVNWMKAKQTSKDKKLLNNLLNNELKIGVDIDNCSVGFEGDLDCWFSAYVSPSGFAHQRSNPAIEIKKIMGISDDNFLYMATKGVAMWSLQSNAKQHPRILEYCKQEFERKNDKSKIELAIILEIASKGSIKLVPTGDGDRSTLKLREENN